MDTDSAKWAAARLAVQRVENGQVVGLGTGSTAVKFLELLGQRVRQGLDVRGVPTSEAIGLQAREWGIELVPDLPDFPRVDLTVDGADQVDPQGHIIKGGGGALLREKLVAMASRQEIILVDPGKLVQRLNRPLPLEVLAFGVSSTLQRLRQAGVQPMLRSGFVSDGGNLVADCTCPAEWAERPQEWHARLKAISGVVDTGLFLGLADLLVIGHPDGTTEERPLRRCV